MFSLVYLDDILIYSRPMREHWDHLRSALDKLRHAKLFGRLHKCEFIKNQMDYLGFEVGKDGIRTSPEKVNATLDWPRPQSTHDMRSFWDWHHITRNLFAVLSASKTVNGSD